MTARTGWAYGRDDGGEWLAIAAPAGQARALYDTRELAEAALEGSGLRGSGLSVAHVAEVSPAAYWITPGTCRRPAAPGPRR